MQQLAALLGNAGQDHLAAVLVGQHMAEKQERNVDLSELAAIGQVDDEAGWRGGF